MKLQLILAAMMMAVGISAQAGQCPEGEVWLESALLCASFEYTQGPFINGRGERRLSAGILTLRDQNREIYTGEVTPYFYLWMKMPNHEHGGRPVTMTQQSDGSYLIDEILLVRMPGQWFLRIDLDPANHVAPETDFDGQVPLTEWL